MVEKKSFKKTFGLLFEKMGFARRGQSWYIDNGRDAIVVFNLQHSDWSNLYYINIEIWLKALGEGAFPGENECHLSFRLERLFPNERDLIAASCDLDKTNEHWLSRLSTFLAEQCIPFLLTCTDLDYLREYLPSRFERKGFIMANARRYLLGDQFVQSL